VPMSPSLYIMEYMSKLTDFTIFQLSIGFSSQLLWIQWCTMKALLFL
jgi:hypothetical protein